jgi:hypothetical protein
MPAPTPRAVVDSEGQKETDTSATEIRSDGEPPADDATDEQIFAFWGTMAGISVPGGPTPSEAVRLRLLSAAEEDPELLAGLLKYMQGGLRRPE